MGKILNKKFGTNGNAALKEEVDVMQQMSEAQTTAQEAQPATAETAATPKVVQEEPKKGFWATAKEKAVAAGKTAKKVVDTGLKVVGGIALVAGGAYVVSKIADGKNNIEDTSVEVIPNDDGSYTVKDAEASSEETPVEES